MKLTTIFILLLACGVGWSAEVGEYTAKAPTDYATATYVPSTYCTYIFSVTGTTNEFVYAPLSDIFDELVPDVVYPLTDKFIPFYDDSGSVLDDSPAFVNGSSGQFAAPILSATSVLVGATASYDGAIDIINSTSKGVYMGSGPSNGFEMRRDNVTSGDLFFTSEVAGVRTNTFVQQDSDGYTGIGFPPGTPGSMLSVFGGVSIGSASAAQAAPTNGLAVEGQTQLGAQLTMIGSSANIALVSNYLSCDGDDEGIAVDTAGNVGVATSTPAAKLAVDGDIWTTGSVIGPSWNKTILGNIDSTAITRELLNKQPVRYTTWLPAGREDESSAITNSSRERFGLYITDLPVQMKSVDKNGTEMLDMGAGVQFNLSANIEQQKQIESLKQENAEIKRLLRELEKKLYSSDTR